MKFNFKKISAIASSILLTSMTLGVAAAANYPAPFVSGSSANVAIVYGTGVGVSSSDLVQANAIEADLADALPAGAVSVSGGEGATEDEVPLGEDIITGKVKATMTDNDIPGLIDDKLAWDDGDGSEDYDIHEEIVITANKMNILTSLDDEDLEGVALSNEQGLEYKFVFDEAVNVSRIGDDDADDLYLDILGQSYLVEDMDSTSITVSIAEDYALKIGDSVTFDGKTFTVDDIFDGKVQVNGEMITEGATKKIDGVRINVDTVGYHSNSPELSKCILKIGNDISKTYSSGDEYIGEDEDDPLWVWDISTPDTDGGYIGVKYNAKVNDADDVDAGDSVKYVGGSYVFPEGFAAVTLDAITDVEYDDIEVSFDLEDLYNLTNAADAVQEDAEVVIIEAPTDSITIGGEERSSLAIFFADNSSGTIGGTGAFGALEVFYLDSDGDVTPSGKWRYVTQKNLTSAATLAATDIADIEVGDTVLDVYLTVASGIATLSFAEDALIGGTIALTLGGDTLSATAGTLEQLGSELEDAEEDDVIVNGSNVGTKDADVMNDYGIIVENVEDNANNDEVVISVPDDRVYATVSVTAGGEVSSESGLGDIVVTDDEVDSVKTKNLIIVGGSCINSAAATALGVADNTCGAAFTAATGVGTGQFLLKSVSGAFSSGKVALVVAGYETADTVAAATYLMTKTVDTSSVDEVYTSSTMEAVLA